MSARFFPIARRGAGLGGTVPMGVTEDPGSNSGATAPMPVELPARLFPPLNWLNIDQLNYVALGALGGPNAVIISFQVPIGYNGVIKKIGNNFVGGGWVEGSGAVVWQVLVDGAPPPGANSYNAILGSLGSPASPTELPGGFRIYENQVVTLVAQNATVVVAGQLVGGRLVGYLYPREEEDAGIWT